MKEQYDHSDHPVGHEKPDDLRAPGGGSALKPGEHEQSRRGIPQPHPVTPPDRNADVRPAD